MFLAAVLNVMKAHEMAESIGFYEWSQWPGLNRRPTVYETVALPLSYIGTFVRQPELLPSETANTLSFQQQTRKPKRRSTTPVSAALLAQARARHIRPQKESENRCK